MTRLVLLNVFLDVTRDHAVILLETDGATLDHKGLGHLASCIIMNRDHCAVSHGRVGEKVGFEFCWCDL